MNGPTKRMPTYRLDYRLPPEERWIGLPQYLRASGRMLARRGLVEYSGYRKVLAAPFRVVTKGRNPYREEIKAVARVLDLPYEAAVIVNYLYELNQLALYGHLFCGQRLRRLTDPVAPAINRLSNWVSRIRRSAMACTAGACNLEGLGMTHVRSMDWPVAGLGRHTLIVHHTNNPAGDFYSVGWPGYCGLLSGFKPGAFSATLNQAFILRYPNLQWPPSHLLRWVFENCADYGEALAVLRDTPVCVPAFVLLASPMKAAVVELAPDGNSVHPMRGGHPIAVANQYLSRRRQQEAIFWEDPEDSLARRRKLLARMAKLRRGDLDRALQLLSVRPIQHADTMQQMVFAHESRSMLVIGREGGKPVRSFEWSDRA